MSFIDDNKNEFNYWHACNELGHLEFSIIKKEYTSDKFGVMICEDYICNICKFESSIILKNNLTCEECIIKNIIE